MVSCWIHQEKNSIRLVDKHAEKIFKEVGYVLKSITLYSIEKLLFILTLLDSFKLSGELLNIFDFFILGS